MATPSAPEEFELPDDWWQTYTAIRLLNKVFRQYILGLLVAGPYNSQFMKSVYTGFLTWYRNSLLWNTAGHVIDELSEAWKDPRFKLSLMRWMDNYDDGSLSAPVHYTNPPAQSWKSIGIDYGVIEIQGLDARSLFEAKRVRAFDLDTWAPAITEPEGYYAVGFPGERTEYSSRPIEDQKVSHLLKATLACLPLRRLDPAKQQEAIDFWDDPGAFYGEILPIIDRPDLHVEDPRGMSGGPIISIARVPGKQFVFRLVGIQRTKHPSRAIIRAEPLERIYAFLDSWLMRKEGPSG